MPDKSPLGDDPQIASRFLLEVDGVEIGVFRSVSGLSINVETEDVHEGGENGYAHKLLGRMTWSNLVFKRGITQGDSLFEWINQVSGEGLATNGNKVAKHTGAVTVIGYDGSRLRSWNLVGVLPVRWSGPTFDSESNTVLEEELEVAHEGFTSSGSGSS
jgi:phage tail-like protein